MHCLTVIYPHPDEPETFKTYYEQTHLPLAARLPGLIRYHYAYPDAVGDSDVFCIFQAYFEDGAAMGAAMESGIGEDVAQDVANYSPKGAQIFHFPLEAQVIERPDPAQFRQAVSRFTTGVTVVTTVDAAGKKIGMTANSFTSVSLTPPTVLISIMRGRTLDAIRRTGKFAVNILPAYAKDLSMHFAGRSAAGLAPEFEHTGGMPKLVHAIAYFDCDATRFVAVADHTVLIGTVCACMHQDEAEPLVFFSSRYHALAS